MRGRYVATSDRPSKMTLSETLTWARTVTFLDEKGQPMNVRFQPGLSEAQIREIEQGIGAPLPSDYRELLSLCAGIDGGILEVDFTGKDMQFWPDEVAPHALGFADDGCGNGWYVDCRVDGEECSQIYFGCHDPAVILFQCKGMDVFLTELVHLHRPEERSVLEDVREDGLFSVWTDNPGAWTREEALASSDTELRTFAQSLPAGAMVIDIRDVPIGMGFSWGRFGPDTLLFRLGKERVFAVAPPARKGGFLSRLFSRR